MERKALTLNEIKQLCDEYLFEIALGNNLEDETGLIKVRYISPTGKFGYTSMGRFFFSGDSMYVITYNELYSGYHNPEAYMFDNRLAFLQARNVYVIPVIFAGIYTGIDDKNGERIFTRDVIKARVVVSGKMSEIRGENYGSKIVAGVGIMFGNFVVILDNHSAPLWWCHNIKRIGSHFPEMDEYPFREEIDIRDSPNTFSQYRGNKRELIDIQNINTMKLTINELLETRGILDKNNVKFIRHKDSRDGIYIDGKTYKGAILYDMYKNKSTRDLFMRYQAEQSSEVYKNVKYIVSFIGEDGSRARFIGVFEIIGEPKEIINKGENIEPRYLYTIKEVAGFEELKERIIIDWGKAAISWHQWMDNKKPKEIIEIGTPLNHIQFKDYYSFILDRSELEYIFENKIPDWVKALTAVNCVYLITDTVTGKQYVGSTYGKEGIWGRWKGYYSSIHNENIRLKALCDSDSNYKNNFKYTILQTLPINITLNEAVKIENIYKEKLGSKAIGLNAN